MTYQQRHYAISILSLLAIIGSLILNGVGIDKYIDIPNLIIVVLVVFVASKLTKNNVNGFIIGGTLTCSAITMIAIFSNITDPKRLGAAIAIVLIIVLYAFIYIFFISNIKQILLSDSIPYNNDDLNIDNSYYFYQTLFIITIFLTIQLGGAGFGAYFNFPSLLMFIPLLATIKLEDKFKGLLLRQNLLFGFVVVNFLISMIGMFFNSAPTNAGVMIALMFLTSFYAIYFYTAWIKPSLVNVKYDNSVFEMRFYVSVVLSIVIPFITLLLLILK